MELTNERLARLLGWRQLAVYFLDGLSPKCIRHPVILQAIMEYTDCLSEGNMRYSAHTFVTTAYEVIERDGRFPEYRDESNEYHWDWLEEWRKENFPR